MPVPLFAAKGLCEPAVRHASIERAAQLAQAAEWNREALVPIAAIAARSHGEFIASVERIERSLGACAGRKSMSGEAPTFSGHAAWSFAVALLAPRTLSPARPTSDTERDA